MSCPICDHACVCGRPEAAAAQALAEREAASALVARLDALDPALARRFVELRLDCWPQAYPLLALLCEREEALRADLRARCSAWVGDERVP